MASHLRDTTLEKAARVSQPSASHYGEMVNKVAEGRAERIVLAGLKRLQWEETDLIARRKGDPGKVEIALELRGNATVSVSWVAQRLNMGTPGSLKWLLCQAKKKEQSLFR